MGRGGMGDFWGIAQLDHCKQFVYDLENGLHDG